MKFLKFKDTMISPNERWYCQNQLYYRPPRGRPIYRRCPATWKLLIGTLPPPKFFHRTRRFNLPKRPGRPPRRPGGLHSP